MFKLMIRIIKKILRILSRTFDHFVSVFYAIFYPLNDKNVVFLSDVRVDMGGNLGAVYDYLEDQDYNRLIEFKADRRIKRKFKDRIRHIKTLSTSKYIFLDDFSNSITSLKVRKNQKIIQLWHGPGAFKKFGFSRVATGECKKYRVHKGYRKYTHATVSGDYIIPCYAEAFDIPTSRIKATGFPRTDDFFNEDYKRQVADKFFKEYPELKEKKIILFGPTYRGTRVVDASYNFNAIDWDKLYEMYKDEYVFILKWHPALFNNIDMGVVESPDFSKYEGFIYDFSFYRDINDLMIVCDTLITDYSSLIFDYVLLNKPVIYFAYDLDDYCGKNGRGLYFDFEEYVYGEVATNSDELLKAIQYKNINKEKREIFFNKFMSECDGHSTEKTCKWIFEK